MYGIISLKKKVYLNQQVVKKRELGVGVIMAFLFSFFFSKDAFCQVHPPRRHFFSLLFFFFFLFYPLTKSALLKFLFCFLAMFSSLYLLMGALNYINPYYFIKNELGPIVSISGFIVM